MSSFNADDYVSGGRVSSPSSHCSTEGTAQGYHYPDYSQYYSSYYFSQQRAHQGEYPGIGQADTQWTCEENLLRKWESARVWRMEYWESCEDFKLNGKYEEEKVQEELFSLTYGGANKSASAYARAADV